SLGGWGSWPPGRQVREEWRVRPADRVLDGHDLIPLEGGSHHGPRPTSERTQGRAVATLDQRGATQRPERAGLLCPTWLSQAQLLCLAADPGTTCGREGRVRAGAGRRGRRAGPGQRPGSGPHRWTGGTGRPWV